MDKFDITESYLESQNFLRKSRRARERLGEQLANDVLYRLNVESRADTGNKGKQLSRYLWASSLCTAVVKFLAFTTGRSDARLLRPENLNEEQSAADSLPFRP